VNLGELHENRNQTLLRKVRDRFHRHLIEPVLWRPLELGKRSWRRALRSRE
jgi:hypothetical protein